MTVRATDASDIEDQSYGYPVTRGIVSLFLLAHILRSIAPDSALRGTVWISQEMVWGALITEKRH